ncbi:MAG: alpha/beta fold hydrolase [Chloroflexi bacterium CFX7]|nr:alpha/beta fold hydrolase [Chloroflexi bacterium CFX7]
MPYASVNGTRLYFEQHGAGDDLVLLHGAGGNHLSWWQQLPKFSRSFRCTVYDARGWGLSRGDVAAGRWAFGTDLIALMDHLGIEHAHVVAHSMGGRAVAGLARLAPRKIRSLVLSGTTAGAEHALASEFEQAQPALALLYRQINALNPPRPRGMLGRPPPSYRGSMHGFLSDLGIPVLFIVGEHDRITSPEMVRQASSLVIGAIHHEIPGAGHSAYFERADEWNRIVLAFLAALPEAGA